MSTERKELFEKCYRQHSKNIFRFIYFKVNDTELAKDFTADTFIKCWKLLDKGEKIKNSRAILYKIAHGIVIDHYRKKKIRKTVPIDSVDEFDLVSNEDLEAKLSVKQQSEELLGVLKSLKKEYQDILLMYYIDELSVGEISKILDKKENAIRVLIHRAIKALKEKYEKNRLN